MDLRAHLVTPRRTDEDRTRADPLTRLELPVSDALSMDQAVSRSTGQQRFNMLLMTVLGAAALLLAAIGIYGLVAYTVEQRRHEIGIRLALGAEASQVTNMVVRQGMSIALPGVLVGTGAASVLSRVLESLLFGVRARDPVVFGPLAAYSGQSCQFRHH